MKKTILITIVFFLARQGFSQTSETLTEEAASNWVKISPPARQAGLSAPGRTEKKAAAGKKEKSVPRNTSSSVPADDFSKTNSQVKRFKKQKSQ